MSHDRTSSFCNEVNQRVVRKTVGKTSASASDVEPYGIVLPTNINIFSSLSDRMAGLEDHEVTEQVRQVLIYLYRSLQRAYRRKPLNNYLSRMNLVQQDDKAALLEWNFEDFRVGFTLEPVRSESSFFVVSQDKSAGSLMADTQKLDADISRSVDQIVEYVLENT
ncbi:MAG: hypothetical protein LBL26_06550 [Peptococcaceae bacterium]|jgi:hypothetical protein|nr:hypothetical protein [Peptococcaceae bacterium]